MNNLAANPVVGRQSLRVLLVEDDDTDARIVSMYAGMSEKYDFALKRVKNIDKAWEALQDENFDLCFLDYLVGQQTSLKLLTSLDRPESQIATVVLSNISMRDVETFRIPSGGAFFLAKGECSAKNLDNAVQIALRSRRRRAH
jgi:DNA-binding NtrC family response regulator